MMTWNQKEDVIVPVFGPTERAKQEKPQDNLKPEGPEKTKYQPGESPSQVSPEDNLKPEGAFYDHDKPSLNLKVNLIALN